MLVTDADLVWALALDRLDLQNETELLPDLCSRVQTLPLPHHLPVSSTDSCGVARVAVSSFYAYLVFLIYYSKKFNVCGMTTSVSSLFIKGQTLLMQSGVLGIQGAQFMWLMFMQIMNLSI